MTPSPPQQSAAVLERPDAYPHRRAGHCGSGALRDLLEFHRLSWGDEPLSEGMAFGLAGGLGFFYGELPGIKPPLYLVGRTAGLERDFCEHLGIGLDLRQTDDPQLGWGWLAAELDAGRPTMVWADIKHLDYLRVRMHNTMHDIVVLGYDTERGVAWVADNDRDEIQACSLESLARARSSDAFPGPNRHATWVMEFPRRLPPPATAVRAGVARAVANMKGGGDGLTEGFGAAGLAGVTAFAERYPLWPEAFDDLGSAMAALRVFIVKAGTGGAMFRSLEAEFLADAAALLGDPGLRHAATQCRVLSEAWRELAGHAGGDDSRAAHAAGRASVERIFAYEEMLVRTLERWLETAAAADG